MHLLPTIIVMSAMAAPAAGMAGDITVSIEGLRSDRGSVRVAVCPEDSFTKPSCPYTASVPATSAQVTVDDVPDGIYAVQAYHDENSDQKLNRRGLRPFEGLAFSNDAPMRFGPPRFPDAAVRVRGDGRITLNMRYYQ
ncbi:DUF2141 domain-containing protein [Palleronia abyssalis]|uniref:DUF2141 domain-containing protein n=1 Tax=Palleronia abyssalis TaxID=1501240 RepID=A0A2R8BYV3_9RHOB|nr:DUF2141 domain-containing protein [Palleronia abyssalis]SPJ25293.1 hypothetical protein PAA8504_03144 [Palleronia abyssalis]